MKLHIKKQSFYLLLIVSVLFVHSVFAQDTSFHRVELAYGISLEIPSHWKVLSQETRQNLRAGGEAVTKNADIEGASGKKESLLAVNATPDPTGAMVRVSVTSPPDYTQADLAAATPKDLKEVGTEMQNVFRKAEASGGPKIIEMQPVRMENCNYLAVRQDRFETL